LAFPQHFFVDDEFVNGCRPFVQHDKHWTTAFAWDVAQACINAVTAQSAAPDIDNWQRVVVDLQSICTSHEFLHCRIYRHRELFGARSTACPRHSSNA